MKYPKPRKTNTAWSLLFMDPSSESLDLFIEPGVTPDTRKGKRNEGRR